MTDEERAIHNELQTSQIEDTFLKLNDQINKIEDIVNEIRRTIRRVQFEETGTIPLEKGDNKKHG